MLPADEGYHTGAELLQQCQNDNMVTHVAYKAPVQKSSSTSIKGRPMISRQGGKELRDLLYMCAMNAKKNNIACKALYERLIAKGKSGKLALIAVCNRFLRQVFAVVKNNTTYQPNYCSPKP